jgi:hypothetical protein
LLLGQHHGNPLDVPAELLGQLLLLTEPLHLVVDVHHAQLVLLHLLLGQPEVLLRLVQLTNLLSPLLRFLIDLRLEQLEFLFALLHLLPQLI